MSPHPEHSYQTTILAVSEASYEVNSAMQNLQDARDHLESRQRHLNDALLCAVLYAGMNQAQLSRVTGYSRRQIGRLLREASAWV
jgi:NTP pyrophosphatase (non-canonical NTP hydrolase)